MLHIATILELMLKIHEESFLVHSYSVKLHAGEPRRNWAADT